MQFPSLNVFGGKGIDKTKGDGAVTQQVLVDHVNKEFERRRKERLPFELQWRLNIAFIEGNQYLDINPVGQDLLPIPKMYEWQQREVFNHTGPIVETRIAKLSRMRPSLIATPGTNAQEDIRSAKVGSMILKNTYKEQEMPSKLAEMAAWSEACGSVFAKSIWNPSLGRALVVMQSEEDELGQASEEEIREGDTEVIVVPAQEIYPDNCYESDIKKQRSIIHAKAYPVSEIAEIWGQEVAPEGTTVLQLQRSMVGVGGLGYGLGGFHYASTTLTEHAIVKEYSERPSKKYPKGRLIIVAGGKLLHAGPLPYPVGKEGGPDLPFDKYDCIKRVGCFWGRTVVERLIPVQRCFNALKNRKAEFLNRASIGQWNVEEESLVDGLTVFLAQAGMPGTTNVYHKGSTPPTPVQYGQLPPEFETEEASLLQMFSMISGVSELSRQSQAPVGVKSGVALSIALEQDDTRLSSTASNYEQALTETGKKWLRLYKHFAVGPRTVRDIGKDNIVDIMDWSGADIKSDDVIVEGTSAVVESPAQRRQMVFDLLSSGLFNDPETGSITKEGQSKVFEMLELGNWEAGDDDTELHIQKAERENRMMADNIPTLPVSYDDDLIHIARHNKHRLTTDYEELKSQNPLIDMLFSQHVDMHMRSAQQKAMMQLEQQMAMQAFVQPPEEENPGGKGVA